MKKKKDLECGVELSSIDVYGQFSEKIWEGFWSCQEKYFLLLKSNPNPNIL